MNVITGLHVNKETAAVDVTGRTKSFLCSGLNCTFDTAGILSVWLHLDYCGTDNTCIFTQWGLRF